MYGGASASNQLSNGESTSGQIGNRRPMRADEEAVPRNGVQKFIFCCFPIGFNLNPARIILAEILGTFILIFSICGIEGRQLSLTDYAATAGSAIVVIVFSVGAISGAHVNPAITLAFAIFGHFSWSKVPFYVSAQVLGAIIGTYLGELVYGVKPEVMLTTPVQDHTAGAFFAELIATFMVTFLAASLAKDAKSVGHISGFVLGIAITLAVLITGPISGGSLNPARSIGPAILCQKFDYIWIYLLAPIMGATLGVLMVHVLCLQQQSQQALTSSQRTNSVP